MSTKDMYILTPPEKPEPQINGAKIFGVRPGAPFLFRIAATGKKPLEYSAENLPEGLEVNPATGIIHGSVKKEGTHTVTLGVSNKLGKNTREFRIEVGDKICLTPPMGWNSWYVNSLWVSQETVKKQIQAMHDTGLADHGWTYINIDDGWQGRRNSETNILEANSKFPDMNEMCDFAHNLGIKMGIYSTPWVGSYAGYIGGSSPNKTHNYSQLIVEKEDMKEEFQILGEKGRHKNKKELRVMGEYMGDYDAKQWDEWGFDYLKYDWNPNDIKQTTLMRDSLRKCNRDIVYSLSNNAPFKLADNWKELANVWRTTGDIIDLWMRVAQLGFTQNKWAPYAGPGHWNDPDMLVIGKTASPHKEHSEYRPTRLSADEQYCQMSQWCLLSAPLLISCDIPSLKEDSFTLNLLTNDEVIAVNQDPLGEQARKISFKKFPPKTVWAKNLEDGSKAIGLFNLCKFKRNVSVSWEDLGISGEYFVRDLWRQKDLGTYSQNFKTQVNSHGVVLISVRKK